MPAAGICGLATGKVVTVHVRGDVVANPRCLVVRHDQRLRVTNELGRPITVTLGSHFRATIPNRQTYEFPVPLGTYLAPGVHDLVATSAFAPEIWVDAVCRGPGATDCATP